MSARDRIYLDYNATAPVRPEVARAVAPLIFDPALGNPSSVHFAGRAARAVLEDARRRIAARFGRKATEIVFTSGGTESDNLAILGVRARRILVSAVEHPAVRAAAAASGAEVVEIPVDHDGALDLEALARALPADLVSVMAVNNETGVVHPIDEVLRLARAAGAIVHVDAVQGAGRRPLPVEADLVSLSAHKIGGLPGVGVLVTRERIAMAPIVHGGAQERGLRAGTASVALAASLALALELADDAREAEEARLEPLRERLDAAIRAISGTRILGRDRVAGTTTAVFSGIEGESLVQALDLAGIATSTGSACASGSLEPSPVMLALGVPAAEALSAVRFSLGFATTADEIERVAAALPALLAQVRGV